MFKILLAIGIAFYLCYLFINSIIEDIKYKREFKVKAEKLAAQLEEIDWEVTDNQLEKVKSDYEDNVKKIKEHESVLVTDLSQIKV